MLRSVGPSHGRGCMPRQPNTERSLDRGRLSRTRLGDPRRPCESPTGCVMLSLRAGSRRPTERPESRECRNAVHAVDSPLRPAHVGWPRPSPPPRKMARPERATASGSLRAERISRSSHIPDGTARRDGADGGADGPAGPIAPCHSSSTWRPARRVGARATARATARSAQGQPRWRPRNTWSTA